MATRPHRLLSRIIAVVALAVLASACGDDAEPAAAPTASAGASETTAATSDETDTTEAEVDEAETTTTQVDETAADDTEVELTNEAPAEELFPDVIGATAIQDADGTWTFSATLSSPYDSPERYADAWRVVDADGNEYAVRVLTHDHANEQPFTRSQGGVAIPDDVSIVTIEGRDQVSGWGGATFELELAR